MRWILTGLNDQNMLERSTISCDKLGSVVMNFSIIISILISAVLEWNCSYMESQAVIVAKRSSSTRVLVQQLYGKAIISKLHTQASVSNPLMICHFETIPNLLFVRFFLMK